MLIESITPLKVKLPTGDVHLRPGIPAILPDEFAQRLLEKVPGKVRILRPGERICWESPALGCVEGEYLGVGDAGTVSVYHPITEAVVSIPGSWLTVKAPLSKDRSMCGAGGTP